MPKPQTFLAFTKRFAELPQNKKAKNKNGRNSDPNTNRGTSGNNNPRLTVLVRKRPLNKRELEKEEKDVVVCASNEAIVREPKLKVDLTKYTEEHHFLFDRTYHESHANEDLYHQSVRPLVEAAFNGARCTCFAYGQTGSGKTYTMMGPGQRSVDSEGRRFYDDEGERNDDSEAPPKGIFLLAAEDFFQQLKGREQDLQVIISFYEIYCGKLFDLLNRRQLLHARENAKNKVVIVGLTETQVSNVQEVMHVIEFGLQARTTGVTGANIDSSRSHAILQITLKTTSGDIHGQVSFIDLAGSERGANTLDQDRQTRLDGAEINKSLLALKECIRALDQQLEHTPFRGSKLTQVLKDSFVGEYCRTVMIATVSPTAATVEHTLNTLRYAYRVKELQDRGPRSEESKRHYSPPVRLVEDDGQRSGVDAQPPRLPSGRSDPSVGGTVAGGPEIITIGNDSFALPMGSSSSASSSASSTANTSGTGHGRRAYSREQESSMVGAGGGSSSSSFSEQPQQQLPPPRGLQQKEKSPALKRTPRNRSPGKANRADRDSTSSGHARGGPRASVDGSTGVGGEIVQGSSSTNTNTSSSTNSRTTGTTGALADNSRTTHAASNQRQVLLHAERESQMAPTSVTREAKEEKNVRPASRYEKHDGAEGIKGSHQNADRATTLPRDHRDSFNTTTRDSNATTRPEAKDSFLGRDSLSQKEEFPELRDLVKRHDQLISLILQEEEDLIASHRQHIDSMVDLVKEEMVYINQVDRPGSDVDAYVAGLEHILALKTQYVEEIRSKVTRFQEHLREEDSLSKKFQERKNGLAGR
ncbi:unnamed protein product [Amoebophrya sp. A120]|nr:unnamed protein product [Amoebophrya sp. A120]|eukprot:GSA120T00023106001.1